MKKSCDEWCRVCIFSSSISRKKSVIESLDLNVHPSASMQVFSGTLPYPTYPTQKNTFGGFPPNSHLYGPSIYISCDVPKDRQVVSPIPSSSDSHLALSKANSSSVEAHKPAYSQKPYALHPNFGLPDCIQTYLSQSERIFTSEVRPVSLTLSSLVYNYSKICAYYFL